jgi:ubiquinone/menaquinone biosynthesis C-methylase UbiE
MSAYSRKIFPRLMDLTMSHRKLGVFRGPLVRQASGDVLEIGFGTGLNLPFYDAAAVRSLSGVDPNPGMLPLARKAIATSVLSVQLEVADAQSLPFRDGTFDTVVSTWTLCSIPQLQDALAEVARVLKPTGRFLFLEHGLSENPKVGTWQRRLTPIQRFVAGGCHLDRAIDAWVRAGGFEIAELSKFPSDLGPRIFSFLYSGVARKS